MADRQMAIAGRPALVLIHPGPPGGGVEAEPQAAPDVAPLVAPAGLALLPGEAVLTLTVGLPPMAAGLRIKAAAFAVEDQIAQPLDKAHVVLGPQLPGQRGRWLVAVLDRSIVEMPAVLAGQRLIADYLMLPVPATGWMVWGDGKRLLARLPDGSGFATQAAEAASLWAAAGRPVLYLAGGILPADLGPALSQTSGGPALPLGPGPWLKRFDLRSGNLAGQRPHLPRGMRAVLAILGLAILAHGLLAAAGLHQLRQQALAVEIALRAALTAEGQPPDLPIEAALAGALASRQPAPEGDFLPLTGRAFAAMASLTGDLSLRDLAYDAESRRLRFTIGAPDLQSLQDVETALTGAGLTVIAGAATTGAGGAEAVIEVWAAGPGTGG